MRGCAVQVGRPAREARRFLVAPGALGAPLFRAGSDDCALAFVRRALPNESGIDRSNNGAMRESEEACGVKASL